MTLTPMIAVADVERSSAWYSRLLGVASAHGGPYFDMLCAPEGQLVLMLHCWNADEHPSMQGGPAGGGVPGLEMYIRLASLEELNAVYARALELEAEVSGEPTFRELSHQHEFRVKDLDGYTLVPCWSPEH